MGSFMLSLPLVMFQINKWFTIQTINVFSPTEVKESHTKWCPRKTFLKWKLQSIFYSNDIQIGLQAAAVKENFLYFFERILKVFFFLKIKDLEKVDIDFFHTERQGLVLLNLVNFRTKVTYKNKTSSLVLLCQWEKLPTSSFLCQPAQSQCSY